MFVFENVLFLRFSLSSEGDFEFSKADTMYFSFADNGDSVCLFRHDGSKSITMLGYAECCAVV